MSNQYQDSQRQRRRSLNQENAKSVLRDKVQFILKNISSRKQKPFSEQSLNREEDKHDYTISKKIYSDNKRTKRIVVDNTAKGNVSRKYHYQHRAEKTRKVIYSKKKILVCLVKLQNITVLRMHMNMMA